MGTANLAGNAISAIFWFYLANLLGTTDFGYVMYFLAIANIATAAALLGAGNTMTVYTAKDVKIQASLYFLTTISSFIAAIVVFLLFYDMGISLFVIGLVGFSLVSAELLGRKLFKDYSKYLITQKILFVGLTIIFYYLIGRDGIILGYALSFFPYFYNIYRSFRTSKISLSLIKPRFNFMMNSYGVSLLSALNFQVDKLIILPLFSLSLLGNYQLGFQFLMILNLIPFTVYLYILPHDAAGNPNKKLKKYTVLLSIGLAFLGIVLSPVIIPPLFPQFEEAVEIIQIMSIAVVPLSATHMYNSTFFGRERSRIVMIGSLIYLAIQIPSIYILSEPYGIVGAAFSIVLAASIQTAFLSIVYQISKRDN